MDCPKIEYTLRRNTVILRRSTGMSCVQSLGSCSLPGQGVGSGDRATTFLFRDNGNLIRSGVEFAASFDRIDRAGINRAGRSIVGVDRL
jgi:hypothetical protein